MDGTNPAAPDTSDAARVSPPRRRIPTDIGPPASDYVLCTPNARNCFDLRWAVSGNLIKHCIHVGDPCVERYKKLLDEGYFEENGAPPAADGESYHLFYGDIEPQCGQHFSYYDIPQNATIWVVRRSA